MSSKRAWFLVGFMWVAYFLNYSDRQVVFSIFPVLKSELHFTNTQLGLTSSIFLWVYALCSPIAGQIGDRVSKRMLVVLSLVLWSLATVLTGFSRSVLMLLSCRALIGITESLFVPSAVALTASAHSPAMRSRAVSLLNTAQLAGVAMGGWYGGFIAQRFHWRLAFYSLGLFGVFYAIPYSSFLRKTSEGVPEGIRTSGSKLAITALIKVRTFWVVSVVFPVFTFVLWLLYTWLPNFFYEKFSLSLAEAGFTATAYVQGATFVGMLCGSGISDYLYRRHKAARFWMVNTGLLLLSPCVHWIGNTSSLYFAVVATVGFGFGCGLAFSSLQICSFDVVPIDTRASALGFLNLVGGFVSGFAALLGGVWKESVGIQTLMTYAALACFLAGLLMILGIKLYFQRDYDRVH